MMRTPRSLGLLLIMMLAGCGDLAIAPGQAARAPASPASSTAKAVPAKTPGPPPASGPKRAAAKRERAATEPANSQRTVTTRDDERRPPQATGSPEEESVKKIGQVIRDSLELDPTLVVWLIDRTASAQELVHQISQAAQRFYDSAEVRALAAQDAKPLQTAVVAFDERPEFLVDPPTGDIAAVRAALEAIQPSDAAREKPFTAVRAAIDKYLPLRVAERREIVLVLVTDEAGDDASVVEALIEPLRRNAIPLYVIGLPAPWGQQNPFAPSPKAAAAADDLTPILGPESFQSERVDIDSWNARYGSRDQVELVDSGFGPFAFERLCRASRGKFLIVRPEFGYGYRGASALSWPTGGELRFEEAVVGKYAPDYVSPAEYEKLLAENKACAALCEAARLPRAALEGMPSSRFPKEADAKLAKTLSSAQQFAAKNLPPVDRLYEVLSQGESDRTRLTSPRWQAQYDLAFGRVLASKARLDGYNSMIAALKRGKTFQNPDSKEWVLEPADHFETESTIRRMAEKAKTYLERVVHEHPGTPWAEIAQQELRSPLGWQWQER